MTTSKEVIVLAKKFAKEVHNTTLAQLKVFKYPSLNPWRSATFDAQFAMMAASDEQPNAGVWQTLVFPPKPLPEGVDYDLQHDWQMRFHELGYYITVRTAAAVKGTTAPPIKLYVYKLPTYVHQDDEGRLHNMLGPSVSWGVDHQYYHYHGVSMNKDEIENPNSIDCSMVMFEPNVERRRALVEIVGMERIIAASDIKVWDEDVDDAGNPRRLLFLGWEPGTEENVNDMWSIRPGFIGDTAPKKSSKPQYRWSSPGTTTVATTPSTYLTFSLGPSMSTIETHDTPEPILIVEVVCPSTHHTHYLRVSPECKTVSEAVAWTFGMEPDQYKPIAEA